MKFEYDEDVDAAYIYLEYLIKEGESKRTIELNENIILDFDERGFGWVRKGKGGKDRPFIIAKSLDDKLKKHIKENCNTTEHLFVGKKDNILTVRTVQEIVKKAAKKACINKRIHPHSLRHSFATHIIENGYDVATLQPLLGHNSAETTMRYIHMADPRMIKVVSPYDLLKKEDKNKD